MVQIIWNEAPTSPSGKGLATVYSATDAEKYRGFLLSRDKEGFIVTPGIEGKFTAYNLAKAAIDHLLLKETIKDDVTVPPLC